MSSNKKIPDEIKDDFFDDPYHDFMEGLFYEFKGECLTLGGSGWVSHKRGWKRNNDETRLLESKLLQCFGRSQVLEKQMRLWKEKSFVMIEIEGVWLDDWKPFWLAIAKHRIPVKKLVFGGRYQYKDIHCRLSKMGAQTLKWLLNSQQSGFPIEHVSVTRLCTRECKNWMNAFSGASIKSVNLNCQGKNPSSWFLSLFAKRCRTRNLKSDFWCTEEEYEKDERASFDIEMDHTTSETEIPNKIDYMEISLSSECERNDYDPEATVETYKRALQSAHVKSLKLTLVHHFDQDLFTYMLKDLQCQEISIEFEYYNAGWIETDGLASLIREGGHLKHLHLLTDNKDTDGERLYLLGSLLEKANLSFLDTLRVDSISKKDGSALSAICNHLAENKGPKCLKIALDNGIHDNYYTDDDESDDDEINDVEALKKLGKSLKGNTKIEELAIDIIKLNVTVPALMQFIKTVVTEMPRLSWLEFYASKWRPEERIARKNDERYRRISRMFPDIHTDDYRKKIATMVDNETDQKNMILQHVKKNKTIKHLRLPFDDYGLGVMMDEVPKYDALLRSGNDISDGIWSHALGRIKKIKEPNLMFHIVKQIPRLFQCALQNRDKAQQPLFTVPHHPNCPGCEQRQVGMPAAKRARTCIEK